MREGIVQTISAPEAELPPILIYSEETMRTIHVTGKGLLKIHPDQTVITMDLEGRYLNYDETLRHSAEDTEQLKDILGAFGFERSDLKTVNFTIDTEYESYKVRIGSREEYKRRLTGYKYSHTLKVEFMSDNVLLGKILYALANSPLRPEFRIGYTVKDQEAAKNELLGKAVRDAVAKAGILASASGTVLGAVQSIDYSWSSILFDISPIKSLCDDEACAVEAASVGSYDMNIEPDDIEVSDTVTIVWEIG